jgi:hypothetical protein
MCIRTVVMCIRTVVSCIRTVVIVHTDSSHVHTDSSHSAVKGKFRHRKDREDPDGEWRYSATFSLTSSLDGGA